MMKSERGERTIEYGIAERARYRHFVEFRQIRGNERSSWQQRLNEEEGGEREVKVSEGGDNKCGKLYPKEKRALTRAR